MLDFRGLTQDEVLGQDGLIKQLTGRILQKTLEAEMTEHLGYEKNSTLGVIAGIAGMGTQKKQCYWKTKARQLRFHGVPLSQ